MSYDDGSKCINM